jgi:hypothetical protein
VTAKGLVGKRIVSIWFNESGRELVLRVRFSTNATLQVKQAVKVHRSGGTSLCDNGPASDVVPQTF